MLLLYFLEVNSYRISQALLDAILEHHSSHDNFYVPQA